ncbi:MAG: ABC transporter substrate-binding protein [Candidatus Limnocylindrales bacterium]
MARPLIPAPLPGPARHRHRRGPVALFLATVLVALGLLGSGKAGSPVQAAGRDVRILVDAPSGLDPAAQSDLASAAVDSQLFETLTAVDSSLSVRPALAASWDVLDGGRRVVFHLRPGLTFSDGSPLRASDVVAGWLRVVDPAHPSPLASLLVDVEGVADRLAGKTSDPAALGFKAVGDTVEVRLRRPASDFPAIAASPTLAIVPASIDRDPRVLRAGSGFVGSGAYVLNAETTSELTLQANPRYWAGPAPISTVHLVTDLGGRSALQAFGEGTVDYAPIAETDASWIAYDRSLGPDLRSVGALSIDYYGFDTRTAPFSDPLVRRAFAMAVDWRRLVAFAGPDAARPATSMVPPGIPGRSDTDFGPRYDPAAARQLLAQAGFPGGQGFPKVALVTSGYGYDEGILAQLKANLGLDLGYEVMAGDEYFTRLSTDPPAFWALTWVVDYPGPDDFLGLLLGTGQRNDYGGWSSAEFDAAIAAAGAATDPAAIRAAFDRAQAVVQRDVPAIPVSYGTGWAIAQTGLLGAAENGLGILRLAGLAWASGS